MNMPADPVMLLSFVNTKLRDEYGSLEEFAAAMGVEAHDIEEKLSSVDYRYDKEKNRFI